MARPVEDSDDEFPDLAVVIGKHKRGAETKATRENPTKKHATKAVPNQAVVISTARLQSADLHMSPENLQCSKTDFQKPKSKRRVLNKICDNPLLRPFDHQKESTASLSSSKMSELKLKSLLAKSKVHKESKATGRPSLNSASEEEELSMQDSTGLSDFVVDDSSIFDEDSTDEDVRPRPPRSTRRLVRGRRPPREDSSEEEQSRPRKDILNASKNVNMQKIECSSSQDQSASRDLDEPLALLSLSSSKNGPSEMIPQGECLVTPPTSPQKTQRRLLSPRKGPRIPMTPHGPSMDAFWDPDVINEWNEEYSPRKTPKSGYDFSNDGLEIGLPTSPNKKSKSMRDPKEREAKKAFTQKKHDIAEAFLRELDEAITNGKVSEMAALTDGIKIIWNKKLNTTAGRANWKRETMRSTTRGADGKPEMKITYRHYAFIELAEKVINDEERLLNVIAHEFCHLANFMVSGIRDNPHGKEFKAWAAKCSQQFGDRGIHVTIKHSYDIDYKYIWECSNCGTKFKRHSKSIDPLKHQCGSCKSKLVQTKPVPRANTVANEYQLFVKQNMGKVKEQNPGSPQKQIMTMLGKMYQEHKASKLGSTEEKVEGVEVRDRKIIASREESLNDNQVDLATRKLNFLDLTSP